MMLKSVLINHRTFINLQGLLRLREPSLMLRCREIDVAVVESVIEEAKKTYASKAKVSVPKIDIDKKEYLPAPPINSDPHRPSW